MYDISQRQYQEDDEEKEIDGTSHNNLTRQNQNVSLVKDLETCSLYYPAATKVVMGLGKILTQTVKNTHIKIYSI